MAQQTDKKKQEKLIIEIMYADAKDGLYDHIGDTNKKVTMKLYTEEQVRYIINRARLHNQDDTEMFTNEYLLSQETPIELPSDEEIEKETNSDVSIENDESFRDGAKWMRDKILNN